ncbi:hypothetical protein BU25DRAFT_414124 [Macroventuria anomochaeta]|uniref:Uncharacterized protein n=1 Tax=Macroventuria anomochaeta TaxID=301207 RepID=A0ACB6RPK4_9PLEO|nr:uncharacterized protein BU25DRAFT_414124 [Macroventuria anomochaeta]KAF2623657.1 hypothetical protein BU25DRAFT_414124 [Macroventuria anomochaeta]
MIHRCRLEWPHGWILQEDGDPSHGMKSEDNVAQNLCDISWLCSILHPAQSPDLNSIEGCWLILKQRVKKRLCFHSPYQKPWDGTKTILKKILREEWDEITMEEIRARIREMPERCAKVRVNGGEKIRSDLW